jgi:hypothetical protein
MRTFNARLCTLAAGVTLIAGAAFAQTTSPAPKDTVPDANPPAQNLSKELNQSNGVIHPKEVDPAIDKAAPNVRDPNVVPPPGTAGGSPAPQPK